MVLVYLRENRRAAVFIDTFAVLAVHVCFLVLVEPEHRLFLWPRWVAIQRGNTRPAFSFFHIFLLKPVEQLLKFVEITHTHFLMSGSVRTDSSLCLLRSASAEKQAERCDSTPQKAPTAEGLHSLLLSSKQIVLIAKIVKSSTQLPNSGPITLPGTRYGQFLDCEIFVTTLDGFLPILRRAET
ncbi:hypothetical protein Aduo_006194 [Ancylostoma duodenale]